jgi:hypothetical protein
MKDVQPQTDLECLADLINSGAFADDLICLCNTTNLRIQVQNLSLYSDWAALILSEEKAKVTGLIHNADQYGNTNKDDLLKKQLKGKERTSDAINLVQ